MPQAWKMRATSWSRWTARGSGYGRGLRSATTTERPCCASRIASVIPTGPHPTTATSASTLVTAGTAAPRAGGPGGGPSPRPVRAGHQRGEVVRGQERGGRRRPPVVQASDTLPDLRLPQLIVDDAVQVGVVLGEVPRGILQVPEEVGPDVVPAEPPDMPRRVFLQHGGGPATHLVDVIDLPGGVMQERHRRLLDQDVVMVGGAAHERGQARHRIADLEPEAASEKLLRELLAGRPEHDVPQLARPDRPLPQDAGGALP